MNRILLILVMCASLARPADQPASAKSVPAVPNGEKLIAVMEGFRKDIPQYTTPGGEILNYGEFWTDPAGKRWSHFRMTQAVEKIELSLQTNVFHMVTYLKDSDPRLRFMAAAALRKLIGSDLDLKPLLERIDDKLIADLCSQLADYNQKAAALRQK